MKCITSLLIIFFSSIHAMHEIADPICVSSPNVKLVIFTPKSHADAVRNALAQAGAGKIGMYASCSFSQDGVGRWMALEGSHPLSGVIGVPNESIEEKIETICPKEILVTVIQAVKKVHPYDHMGYDIYPLLEINPAYSTT